MLRQQVKSQQEAYQRAKDRREDMAKEARRLHDAAINDATETRQQLTSDIQRKEAIKTKLDVEISSKQRRKLSITRHAVEAQDQLHATKSEVQELQERKAEVDFELKAAKEELQHLFDTLKKLKASGVVHLEEQLFLLNQIKESDPGVYGEPFWLSDEDREMYDQPLYSGQWHMDMDGCFWLLNHNTNEYYRRPESPAKEASADPDQMEVDGEPEPSGASDRTQFDDISAHWDISLEEMPPNAGFKLPTSAEDLKACTALQYCMSWLTSRDRYFQEEWDKKLPSGKWKPVSCDLTPAYAPQRKDLYLLIDQSHVAESTTLHKAIRRMTMKTHPDKCVRFYPGVPQDELVKKPIFDTLNDLTKLLNNLKDCLGNPWLRLYYDTTGIMYDSINHGNYHDVCHVTRYWDEWYPHFKLGKPVHPDDRDRA